MAKAVDIDADIDNADWTKQSWDLPCRTLDDLREYLRQTGTSVAEFKRLPVYRFNVDTLPWLADL